MTRDDILMKIQASPTLRALVPDTILIAKELSKEKIPQTYLAGKGDVLNTLGLEVGNAVCDFIDDNPLYRHIKHLPVEGRLDLNLPLARMSLQAMVGVEIAPGVTFTQDHYTALTNLCLVPVNVDEFEVRCAIYNDDGSLKV